MTKVATRIAPSPTGYMHIGTLRTALYNYIFAKKSGGKFFLRIEDTDTKRNRPLYEADIHEQFKWSGLLPDGTVKQSDRLGAHRKALGRLIDSGAAYISKEDSKEHPGTEVEIVRLKNPNKTITFTDIVRGDISFDTTDLRDFVIARSPESPLYHFAVVVDDADMAITHVIRGEEHISNTPRQILIQEALGAARPQYAHLPLNLDKERAKLSKRKGDVSVKSYREAGYLAPALLNYLAVIGWTHPEGKEILSLSEMVDAFTLEKVHKSASVFDIEKLRWYNRQYLLRLPQEEFSREALTTLEKSVRERELAWSAGRGNAIIPILHERVFVWEDIREMVRDGELDFFFAEPQLDITQLPGTGGTPEQAIQHLSWLHDAIRKAGEKIVSDPERLKSVVWEYATEKGRGKVLWPMRYALTGKERSPDPFTVAAAIGKIAALQRIKKAIALLGTV